MVPIAPSPLSKGCSSCLSSSPSNDANCRGPMNKFQQFRVILPGSGVSRLPAAFTTTPQKWDQFSNRGKAAGAGVDPSTYG